MVLPYQPWHYQPTLFRRLALEAISRLPFMPVQYKIFKSRIDPSHVLEKVLEDEAQRLHSTACNHHRRASLLGDESATLEAENVRNQAFTRVLHHRTNSLLLKSAQFSSDVLWGVAEKLDLEHSSPSGMLFVRHAFGTDINESDLRLIVAMTDTFGRSPLHFAAAGGRAKQCLELLRHGANANHADGYGNTPLHYWSMTHRKPEDIEDTAQMAFRALIDFGADPEAPNLDGRTPRQIAPQAPYFQALRKQERLERLARKQQRNRKAEASTRRAM